VLNTKSYASGFARTSIPKWATSSRTEKNPFACDVRISAPKSFTVPQFSPKRTTTGKLCHFQDEIMSEGRWEKEHFSSRAHLFHRMFKFMLRPAGEVVVKSFRGGEWRVGLRMMFE
jgi:hypothetical protein